MMFLFHIKEDDTMIAGLALVVLVDWTRLGSQLPN